MSKPQIPLGLPCYDLTGVVERTLSTCTDIFKLIQLPQLDGRCVQNSVTYSPQLDDLRLLSIPTSFSRVSERNLD